MEDVEKQSDDNSRVYKYQELLELVEFLVNLRWVEFLEFLGFPEHLFKNNFPASGHGYPSFEANLSYKLSLQLHLKVFNSSSNFH
jgi:hypothetical protein